MQKITKIIWIATVVFAVIGVLWFTYLYFSNPLAIGPAVMVFQPMCFVVLVFIVYSIVLIIKGKVPTKIPAQIALIIALIMFSFIFPRTLIFDSVNKNEWQKIEEERSHWEKNKGISTDGKYEFVLYTDSSYPHILIYDISSGHDFSVNLKLNTEGLKPTETLPSHLLAELVPTDKEHIYILTTTRVLKDEIETFEIDVIICESKRIEQP